MNERDKGQNKPVGSDKDSKRVWVVRFRWTVNIPLWVILQNVIEMSMKFLNM